MPFTINPNTTVGPVSLSVADLDRSLTYYQHNIGLSLLSQEEQTAVLGAGDTPWLKLKAMPGAQHIRRATGLFHFALLVPSRLELARSLRHLAQTDTPIDGASDHLVSEALYLSDPDGHGIEIYRDRSREAWYDEAGNFKMGTIRLDVESLLGELQQDSGSWQGLHAETVMGHIHLQVADVAAARQFYTQVLGFGHMMDYPSASFVSAGGYHHHIGMNSWMGAGAPPPPENAARLLSYELTVPDQATLTSVVDRVQAAGLSMEEQPDGWLLHDPSANAILLKYN